MIIGLVARKQHGKDTTADHLVKNYKFSKVAFADPLKDACRVLFNLNDEQLYGDQKEVIDPNWGTTPRHILQFIGTEVFREYITKLLPDIGSNFWIKNLEDRYKKALASDKNTRIAVADVRFQNEADTIHKLNGIVIKIIRPSMQSNDEHASEKSIDLVDADYTIINDGTLDDLYKKIDKIMLGLCL